MKILMVAPACDGEDVGEAWVAFQWAKLMTGHHDVTLLTTFKRGHRPMSEQLPEARVIEWQEPAGVGKFERFNSLVQPGYVPFYRRSRKWIRQRIADGERFDLGHQMVPVAMRYPSPLVGCDIPFIIGPVGGSLDSPPGFVAEEGKTPWWQRLRRLDAWRIRRDPALRRTYESAACVIGVADYVREFLSAVDVQRFEIMSETAVHALPEEVDRQDRSGPIRLLFVGRVIRTKGLRDVIQGLDLLRDLNLSLDVVGDGNDRDACLALVDELGIRDRVTFHGKVPRAQVDDFYRAADVFVFPSYREPGGNVSLEAMAFGLPLIVCKRGGPGANVDDSCAIRLDSRDPNQLSADCAAAIRALATDDELRARMGAAARNHAEVNHLWSQRVVRMSEIYGDVAGNDRSAL